MSDAKRCDRCYGYYQLKPRENTTELTMYSYDNELDLCPDCSDELVQWFNKWRPLLHENNQTEL